MLRNTAMMLVAMAAAAPSLGMAQEPVPFEHGHRNGACFVAFDGEVGVPGRLELSFDVAKMQFSARFKGPQWDAAHAGAAGKPVPLTITLNNGFKTTVAALPAAGNPAEAVAQWQPKENSWALFRRMDTANSATLDLGGESAGTFPMGRSSLAYEKLIFCMDDVEKGRV